MNFTFFVPDLCRPSVYHLKSVGVTFRSWTISRSNCKCSFLSTRLIRLRSWLAYKTASVWSEGYRSVWSNRIGSLDLNGLLASIFSKVGSTVFINWNQWITTFGRLEYCACGSPEDLYLLHLVPVGVTFSKLWAVCRSNQCHSYSHTFHCNWSGFPTNCLSGGRLQFRLVHRVGSLAWIDSLLHLKAASTVSSIGTNGSPLQTLEFLFAEVLEWALCWLRRFLLLPWSLLSICRSNLGAILIDCLTVTDEYQHSFFWW